MNKIIKVVCVPDDKILKDLGTVYIKTSDKKLVKELSEIKHFKVMAKFLDANEHRYEEIVKTPKAFDIEYNLLESFYVDLENNALEFS